jgi:transposase-like protein
MLGHGAKFDHKKEEAIAAMLSHRNVEEAARAVGISPNTLLRWMKEPEFKAAYREARRTAFSQSTARLQQASGAAVTTLLKIMLDANAPSGPRLRAVEIVLAQTAQAIEIEDIEVRLTELERSLAKVPVGGVMGEDRDRPEPQPIACAVAPAPGIDLEKVG